MISEKQKGSSLETIKLGSFRPMGIWLVCTVCKRADKIKDSDDWRTVRNSEAAEIFARHGWTGTRPNMLSAKCPDCSTPTPKEASDGNS